MSYETVFKASKIWLIKASQQLKSHNTFFSFWMMGFIFPTFFTSDYICRHIKNEVFILGMISSVQFMIVAIKSTWNDMWSALKMLPEKTLLCLN